MSSNWMLIAELILEWLEFADYLKELLKRIEAGEEITDEELTKGLEDVKDAVKKLKERQNGQNNISRSSSDY